MVCFQILSSVLRFLCHTLAETLVRIRGPREISLFRRLELRLAGVRFRPPLRDGIQVFIAGRAGLEYGCRCALGGFPQFWNYNPIVIGDDFIAGPNLVINTATHDVRSLQPVGNAIRIGHRVWCGANVTILSGVTIGDDVVIGAGSVVTRDLPSGVVAVGVPARVLRELHRTEYWRWTDGAMHPVVADTPSPSSQNSVAD